MFSSLKTNVCKMGTKVGEGVEGVGKTIHDKIDEKTAVMRYFVTGNKVQLVAKNSGKAVQLFLKSGKNGIDALGDEGEDNKNGCWTVEGDTDHASLHIKKKYITVVGGAVQINEYSDPSKLGPEAQFHVTQDGIFVHLESIAAKGHYLGFLASGELKSAAVCVKDEDSKFGVTLISGEPLTSAGSS